MNVRVSSIAAFVCALALGSACGGQRVDNGTGGATSSAGRDGGNGGAGGVGAGGSVGGVNQSAGGSAGTLGTGGVSGSATSAAAGHVGSGGSGTTSGGVGGSFSTSGNAGISSAGAPYAGAPGGAGAGTNTAGSGGANSAGSGGTSGDSSTDPNSMPIPPTWDTVKLILSGTHPPCDGCHGNLGDGGFRINLGNDSQLFKSLTTTIVKDCGNHPVVTPGDPSKSAILQILVGDCSEKTPRMPPGCIDGDAGCVPPEYMTALSQWISDGAPVP